MPLMNKIFYKSYDNLANNKKAVAIRGWYPPSMVLLEHPSLVADENPPPQSMPSLSFPEINVESNLAGSVLDKLLRERGKSEGAKRAAEKRKLTSEMIAETIFKSQRLTSGVMTKMPSTASMIPDSSSPFICVALRLLKRKTKRHPSRGHSLAS